MACSKMESFDLIPDTNVNILLMGKTGHGKSSTGNSILGQHVFKTGGGGQAVTRGYQVGAVETENRVIKVVDTPGTHDTDGNLTEEEKVNLVIDAITTGLRQFSRGFSALLLVLSYSARLTAEEVEAFKILKSILGEDSLRKHAICVFTHGDTFENDNDDKDFLEWCKEEDQRCYRSLFEECGNRIVLFDNSRRADPKTKSSQVKKLISVIDSLQKENGYYTLGNFESEEERRDCLRKETNMPSILEHYSTQIALIKGHLSFIMDNPDDTNQCERLRDVQEKVNGLKMDLSKYKHPSLSGLERELDGYANSISHFLREIGKVEESQKQMEQRDLEIRMAEENRRQEVEDYKQEELRPAVIQMKVDLEEMRQENVSLRKELNARYEQSMMDSERNERMADDERQKSPFMKVWTLVKAVFHFIGFRGFSR